MATIVSPAGAAKRATVEQLEQTLAASLAAHRTDAEIARQLGDVELSERLTYATLDRFAKQLSLGPSTALALELLADRAAFFDPPAAELPATAFPDLAGQQRMMDAARGYVTQALPRLPNFFATRSTNHFDDTPQVLTKGDWPVRAGLHLVGTSSRQITFRDGREIQDRVQDAAATASATSDKARQELGLHTWGEFGPELSVILTDAAKGTVSFHHWEQTPAGLAAVFRYAVPKAASHYSINYCCVAEMELINAGPRGRSSGGMGPQGAVVSHPFNETPGYHGSISIDPVTGTIFRITLEAELNKDDPLLRADTVVEYGPVTIGERKFICPVRSLAVSVEKPSALQHDSAGPTARTASPVNPASLLINETSFTRYHRLGATVRVLADAPEAGSPQQEAASQAPGNAAPEGSAASKPPPASSSVPPAGTQASADAAPPAAVPAVAPDAPQPPAEPVIPEVSLSAAPGVPDEPTHAPQPGVGGFQLKLTSRLVDVGTVAYDKKGHPVTDLNQDDFEVYDNGRKQEIRFFTKNANETATAPPPDATPDRTFTNRAPEAPAASAATAPAAAAETITTVLLIDESNIAWGDLNNARQEMLKFLAKAAPGERIGLYTMSRFNFRVLTEITTDHAALIDRLKKFMPTAQSVSQAQDEEMRNRQQMNEVHNVSDLDSVNGNRSDMPDSTSPVDPQLRSLGSNPARASLIILGGVARHLAALPGHKNLVWVSTDNVFADWQDQAVSIDRGPKSIDSFALRAQEAMNEAHVAVFPMDVSQLEGGAINADIQHRNVELTQAAQDIASLPGASSADSGGGGRAGRDVRPGRITAAMSQDLHPVQEPIRQVAESTGGRVIRRSGDLAAELADVVEAGHATYLVSFIPQGQADGQYHNITVKLAGKHPGLTLRYRTGYLFEKEPATLKERFQRAVWQPREVSEIAVTALVDRMNTGASLKIAIAASDLSFAEQAGRWVDKLDIFFIQRDDAGQHAQVEGQVLGLRLKPSTYQNLLATGVPFERSVQLRGNMASLRVLVVDENSGRMGSVTIPAPPLEAAK